MVVVGRVVVGRVVVVMCGGGYDGEFLRASPSS
jgi:hypothetical protein